MKSFIIASNNVHKVAELDRILNPLRIKALTAKQAGVDLGDVEETGTTFLENARIKALAAYKRCNMPSIADDSGLMVDALNGAPGVYSARYAGEGASDGDKINKLLGELKDVPEKDRTATFVCSICCVLEDGSMIEVNGKCPGTIAFEPKGNGGFGYDPVFIVEGGKSFAQLSDSEKDKISHRGNALRALKEELEKRLN
ncbi:MULTISPECIES: RdgB/HAM1 family non-canonical purine NTP pyrophosphatase [unclassified Ruminococcus]|uniref:RdgB/HAM1 family non-canonical purine NTP pyrophosphatase n=1 Tax=unclassified Ruminococcus TaxID=2608920 RepID=UPI00210A3035|nr:MULTISPECIES: RdgB/HAM1 family non-canonical purine NTP pyrophosphatase [unclassified Ruminococcus]MCQ4021636.1 RdgB/HAM1 family non-canonical purine NTP pyrophosphatase [Ruminococcus sp. zg-924]MCQ4114081.1 RdgB/HAM1 family non-canonical purine NTP pyrophosphatase [Ruminococcus sp. zg-921]